MTKTILITGSTDGIGRLAAERLLEQGHRVLLHGRNATKLEATAAALTRDGAAPQTFQADLSVMAEVEALAAAVREAHPKLDVLINNAGVFNVRTRTTGDGLDMTFAVNTIAPYLLTQRLLPTMSAQGRVVNLSSAAQAPVDLQALAGRKTVPEQAAYAQSKLAITAWSFGLAQTLGSDGPSVVSVNPGSLLATKMVKEAFGVPGSDVGIGADILVRAAVSEEFDGATGRYFDNDARRFGPPHPAAHDPGVVKSIIEGVEASLTAVGTPLG
ncbi:MAG: SDR family NAD(P)-dependent oxidoreductase [Myxococcota bacterium]